MSLFDIFRGFFGPPGGHYRGSGFREPLFDDLTREDSDDDEVEENLDRFDDVFRFNFSLGPNGLHIQEPPMFGQILQEMEDIFSGLGHFSHDLPRIEAPPPDEHSRRAGGSRNPLRDFMLKSPDSATPRDQDPSSPGGPSVPRSPFHDRKPFFRGIWSDEPRRREEERKEDGDLDSQVSSGGLDQILTPTPSQPRPRSFYKSVTVTKVVKPDGTVEERRTVKDGRGNEETTVTRSGGAGGPEGPDASPRPDQLLNQDSPNQHPSGFEPSGDMHDEFSMFSKFFRGFRSF